MKDYYIWKSFNKNSWMESVDVRSIAVRTRACIYGPYPNSGRWNPSVGPFGYVVKLQVLRQL